MNAIRRSPVHEQLLALQPQWDERCGMQMASRIRADEEARLQSVALADLSFLPKVGLKGPAAAQWLEARNVVPPAAPNSWHALPAGGVIASLGRSEFFIEDDAAAQTTVTLRAALALASPGVYPVIRQDAGFALAGPRVNELLVQTCNVNFEQIGQAQQTAVMTQMIGVSVLVLRVQVNPLPVYRLWCDPTFAAYFWETIAEIAGELGGGVVGADSLQKATRHAVDQ